MYLHFLRQNTYLEKTIFKNQICQKFLNAKKFVMHIIFSTKLIKINVFYLKNYCIKMYQYKKNLNWISNLKNVEQLLMGMIIT